MNPKLDDNSTPTFELARKWQQYLNGMSFQSICIRATVTEATYARYLCSYNKNNNERTERRNSIIPDIHLANVQLWEARCATTAQCPSLDASTPSPYRFPDSESKRARGGHCSSAAGLAPSVQSCACSKDTLTCPAHRLHAKA